MFLMYVDESGDVGIPPPHGHSPTSFFFLTGLVIHELDWTHTHSELLRFRHWLKHKYGIYLEDELHAGELLNKPGSLPKSMKNLPKHKRLAIIRHHADAVARLSSTRLINVIVDKSNCTTSESVFRKAWYALFQRFENTIDRKNFPNSSNQHDRGLVFPDATSASVLKGHLNQMRIRNTLLVRNRDGKQVMIDEPIRLIIEDPVCRDSRHSYFLQAVDCAVFLFKQSVQPNVYMKKHGGNAYFHKRLEPVLCKHASNNNDLGVVRL